MFTSIKVIMPLDAHCIISERLQHVLKSSFNNVKHETFTDVNSLKTLEKSAILFVISLDESGINHAVCQLIQKMRNKTIAFHNCIGAVITDGCGDLFTKSVSREFVLAANMAGCAFLGCPLVEATGSLQNFHVQASIDDMNFQEAYVKSVGELIGRLVSHQPIYEPPKNMLVLHTSNRKTSNTLALWEMVLRHLKGVDITEISLRNGTVSDCAGCAYTTCLHFGELGGCFYGGVMVDDVFPAIRRCDTLVLLCPNYNDAVSAGLTAFINRLTALFRQSKFYEKRLYAIIVSGYSGGDIVAQQLISALCMNKSFYLPAYFCMMETANDAKSILLLNNIQERAMIFAGQVMNKDKT